MSALEHAVEQALLMEGATQEANKAYLEFIKANFLIPIEKDSEHSDPRVLYLCEGEHVFLPVFTNKTQLDEWAKPIEDEIALLNLTGVNLLKGIEENVTVCLNIGSQHYKEFNPQEIARMRSMVLKLFK